MTYQELFQKAKHLENRVIDFCDIQYLVLSVEQEKEIISVTGDLVKFEVIEVQQIKSSTVWLDHKDINKFVRLYASDIYDED